MKAWNTHLAKEIMVRGRYKTIRELQEDVCRLIATYGCCGNLSCEGKRMINQGLPCPLFTGIDCKANVDPMWSKNKRLAARHVLNELKAKR